MRYTRLGEFEELVLLTIAVLDEDAYGVSIKEHVQQHTGRKPSIGALHSALSRMTKKGLINSQEGGATAERGGRRKRYYRLTGAGKEALIVSHDLRTSLFNQIPKLNWDQL